MKKRRKVWLLLGLQMAVLGGLCLWSEVMMVDFRELERERKFQELAEKAEQQAALCRKWADAAQRCSSIRLRILCCGERYCSLAPAEQERIRAMLMHRALPLPILNDYWQSMAFVSRYLWMELELLDGVGKVILSIGEDELQSCRSLREYGRCDNSGAHLNAMIPEEDKVFLTELFKRAEQSVSWEF